MSSPEVKLFYCTICNELLGESSVTARCGHIFHRICLDSWLTSSEFATCPYCRADVSELIKLYPSDIGSHVIKTKEEEDSLLKRCNLIGKANLLYESQVNELITKLNISEVNLRQSQTDLNNMNSAYINLVSSCNAAFHKAIRDASAGFTLNGERSRRILLQKEFYEYQAKNSAEINKLKSELEKSKSENAHLKSKYHDSNKPSTSSENARQIALPRQIQSPNIQSSPNDGFLSNCTFWIIDELRKITEATNYLNFNENRIIEHGGTVAYHYTNMVTHVISISQENLEVLRGIKERKKCVTDYWLSDVIGEKKIKKPWLAHHFPIPYSEDKLPYEHKKIVIANFDHNEYHKIKAMAEITGAIVVNKVSRSTCFVVTRKLIGEMVQKAVVLKVPVVNVQWINDILLGEKITLEHFNREKYQNYEMPNPYQMDYRKVSHLMEAWDEHLRVPKLKLPPNKISMTNKRMKTSTMHTSLPAGVNNGGGTSTITSISTIPNASETRVSSSEEATRQTNNT